MSKQLFKCKTWNREVVRLENSSWDHSKRVSISCIEVLTWGIFTSIVFWSYLCCSTLKGAFVHSTRHTPVSLCYKSFRASPIQHLSYTSPSPSPSPFTPGCAGEIRLQQHLPQAGFMPRIKTTGDLRSMGWSVEGLSPAVCGYFSHSALSRQRRTCREVSLLDGPCTRMVPYLCCLSAAARWFYGSSTASFQPCFRGTQCWKVSQEVQHCVLGQGDKRNDQLSCSSLLQQILSSLRTLYGRTES